MIFHDYASIESQLNETDIFTLMAECDTILAENPTEFLRLLLSALSLSAHVLEKDKTALASQLAGRLYHHYDANGDVKAFVDSITPPKNSLYPIRNGYDPLTPAGGLAIRQVPHPDNIEGVVLLKNGDMLTWSEKIKELYLWSMYGQEIATLRGHKKAVVGGLQLATGNVLSWSYDGTLRLWTGDGEPIRVLEGHTSVITWATELRDGRILSWSNDKTLRLWSADGEPIKTLNKHTKPIFWALELRDGRIVSSSFDATVCFWSATGDLITQTTDSSADMLAELSDGRIVGWDYGAGFNIWSADGEHIKTVTFEDSTDDILRVIPLPNARMTTIGYSEKSPRILNSDGDVVGRLEGHTATVTQLYSLSDGRILTCSDDKTVRIWSSEGKLLDILAEQKYKNEHGEFPVLPTPKHKHHVLGAKELADGRIVSWSLDKMVCIWSANGEHLASLEGHNQMVYDVLELPNGWLLSWTKEVFAPQSDPVEAFLYFWDTTGQALPLQQAHQKRVDGIEILPDKTVISWSSHTTSFTRWGLDGQHLNTFEGHTDELRGVLALPDGQILSWSKDKTLRLWGIDGTAITVFSGHDNAVLGALITPKGQIVSYGTDKHILVWELDGTLVAILSGHTDGVKGACVLANGDLLSWSHDNTLRRWNWDGEQHIVYTGHTNRMGIQKATELADGRIVSEDASWICLWDANGQLIDKANVSYRWKYKETVEWANGHGFDAHLLESPNPLLMGKWDVWVRKGDDAEEKELVVSKSKKRINTFYGDNYWESVSVLHNVVIAGDMAGRVVFLRWID